MAGTGADPGTAAIAGTDLMEVPVGTGPTLAEMAPRIEAPTIITGPVQDPAQDPAQGATISSAPALRLEGEP